MLLNSLQNSPRRELIDPEFDDSNWVTADLTATNVGCFAVCAHLLAEKFPSTPIYHLSRAIKFFTRSSTGAPRPLLLVATHLQSASQRFYGGNLLFRGHFNASGEETDVTLNVMGGFAFGYTAWINGAYLGSGQGNSTVAESNNTWSIPDNTLKVGEDNVLVVLQGEFIDFP